MTIPDAAIEAAAYAMDALEHRQPAPPMQDMARAAIEAAMPAIREAIAQEIEADPDYRPHDAGMRVAARIVRGGADLGRVIPSRSTDPDTSRAAEPVKIKAGTQRAHLLYSFYRFDANGLTDEQAMHFAGQFVSATSEYAKRCSELREGGFIEPTGETRLGAAGTPRIVSRITDKGREWIRENR